MASTHKVKQYAGVDPDRKGILLESHGIFVNDPALSLAVSSEMCEFLFFMATMPLSLLGSSGRLNATEDNRT